MNRSAWAATEGGPLFLPSAALLFLASALWGCAVLLAPDARAEEATGTPALPSRVTAHVFSKPPAVDGDLSEWPEGGAFGAALDQAPQVLERFRARWSGPEDLSAVVRIAVDSEALYLAARVTDDVPFHAGGDWWHGDAIEVFLRTTYREGDPPPEAYDQGCWQIFLMPRNPAVAWGVTYRGGTTGFDDGGLEGVAMAWRARAGGSYDAEVRIPLFNFGITDRVARKLGFALALDDADEGPSVPGTYMSWNGLPDLYRKPAHFGVLELPERHAPEAARADDALSGLWTVLGFLLAALAAVILAGPGARAFARLGPRAKFVGLGLTALLSVVYSLDGQKTILRAEQRERAELERLALRAESIVADAALVGALDTTDAEDRRHRLASLLQGDRVPCLLPPDEAGLVPLRDLVESVRTGVTWRIPLDRPRTFALLEPMPAYAFLATIDVESVASAERPREGSVLLGSLTAFAADGTTARSDLMLPALATRRQWVRASLGPEQSWVRLTWSPAASAPATTLVTLIAESSASPTAGASGVTQRVVVLPGSTADGVPILGGPDVPRLGRTLAPGAETTFDLPAIGGADRLWLVLTAPGAFPETLGDDVVARVTIAYDEGAAATADLRNGDHVSSDRLPAAMQRLPQRRSREAYRWSDAEGVVRIYDAVPLRLDASRRAKTFTLRNLGAAGPVTVVAATVVRSVRPPPTSRVGVAPAEEEGVDHAFVREPEPGFRERLGPGTDDAVRLERTLGSDRFATPLTLSAPYPPGARDKEARTRTALLTCLAVVLFLVVLLSVDLVERFRRLTARLAFGVLAASLVPLGATILLVERTNTVRVEAEQAAHARTVLEATRTALADALRKTRDTARVLAEHAATGVERETPDHLERLVRLYRSTAVPDGRAGALHVSAAGRPPVRVDPDPPGPRLLSPKFLAERGEPAGFRVSPWDGLLLVGTARGGSAEDWVRVTLGLRVDDAFLADEVLATRPGTDVDVAIFDGDGRPLAAAGPDGRGLLRAMRAALPGMRARLAREAPAVLSHVAGAEVGDGERLAVVDRLSGEPYGEPAPWIAVGLPRRTIDRAVEAQRGSLIWLGVFGLFLIVTVASLTARRVADPVKDLVRVTEAVRRGEFQVEVPPAGADEVGDLTVAFDQMRRTLERRVGDLDLLIHAQSRLAESLDFAMCARTALDLFRERFAPDAAVLLDVTSVGGPITVAAEHGRRTAFADRPFTAAPGGWIAKAIEGREPLEIPGPDDPRAVAERGLGARLVEEHRAWIALPLHAGPETMGVVVLLWDDARSLPAADERRLLEPLAGTCAIALTNARLYRLAALDDVTRLPGATAFEATLRADVEKALAGGPRAMLLRIGLDHLEHVVHRQGVEAGRSLLRALADALRAAAGGDRRRLGRLRERELAVRLPGASREEAAALAETIRQRLGAVEVALEGGGEPVTTAVTVGLASCPEDAASVEFLLDAAARAIEAARRAGGDRVADASRLDTGLVDVPPFEEGAVFRSERMVRVVEAARRAAQSDSSVLITGETGTGKEVIAKLVHRHSTRAERAFVTVNCAAFPETLLESELFGHERGAFTGAERRREGRFELADGGTLFLDEIAEMSLQAQVKLLRVLQERQFTRLGGTRTVDVDVRIVAATNRDLEEAVSEGALREDLYYRLNVIRLELPPLRDRREEIPVLVERFLQDVRRRTGRGPSGFTSAAMDVLYRHPWPGNVRELKNVIERCGVLCEADQVGPEHLRLDAGRPEGAHLAPRAAPRDELSSRQRQLLDHLARHGRCTNREYYEMTGTSPRTGLRDLQELIARGVILREGKRRGAVYRLP